MRVKKAKRQPARAKAMRPPAAPLVAGLRGTSAKAKAKSSAYARPSKKAVNKVLKQTGANLPLSVLGTTH
jgi:hypothetical protein